jgi:hypothetical protein
MNEQLAPHNYQETTHTEIIQSAARSLAWAALQLIQDDPHQWSSRPCQTCKAVSSLIGKPFGCLTKNVLNKDTLNGA